MKSFDQYAVIKDLSESIFDMDIDIDQFCENILSNIETSGIENFNEAWFGIPSAARAVSGVLGGLGGMVGDAGSAIDRAGTRLGQKAAGYGMQAMDKARSMGQAAGRYLGDKYNQASDYADRTGKAIAGAGRAAKQYAVDKYEQSARRQAVKQIEDRLHGLRDAMSALGVSSNQINSLLRTANKIVLQSGHELSPGMQSSIAAQAPRRGVGGRFTSGS